MEKETHLMVSESVDPGSQVGSQSSLSLFFFFQELFPFIMET